MPDTAIRPHVPRTAPTAAELAVVAPLFYQLRIDGHPYDDPSTDRDHAVRRLAGLHASHLSAELAFAPIGVWTSPGADSPGRAGVWRVQVDTYPTPDGRPFTEQDPAVWATAGTGHTPAWIPAARLLQTWFGWEHDLATGALTGPVPAIDEHAQPRRADAARIHLRARRLGCHARLEFAELGPWQLFPIIDVELP